MRRIRFDDQGLPRVRCDDLGAKRIDVDETAAQLGAEPLFIDALLANPDYRPFGHPVFLLTEPKDEGEGRA